MIRTHPLSGRQSLYINPNRIDRIAGWSDAEAMPSWTSFMNSRSSRNFSTATNGAMAISSSWTTATRCTAPMRITTSINRGSCTV